MDDTAFDPRRRLCPDGSCVGVIKSDGRCSVCGRTAAAAAAGQDPDPEPELDAGTGGAPAASASGQDASGFDPNRRLCEDGSCVGVIGSDGACTVCGLKAGS